MRKPALFLTILIFGIAFLIPGSLFSQEQTVEKKNPGIQEEKAEKAITYDSGGRRDPFRNMLGGSESKDASITEGVSHMTIEQVILIGIIKVNNKLTAIINGPQGFPYHIVNGDKFQNGFVLSVKEDHVVFRKTKDRGMPLYRPRDIVKDLYEER